MGFRQAVNDLADAARRQSADGVAYSYVRMTIACVSCHRSLRDVKKP
jgi:cytochrome c556